jgi:hypothetical protein
MPSLVFLQHSSKVESQRFGTGSQGHTSGFERQALPDTCLTAAEPLLSSHTLPHSFTLAGTCFDQGVGVGDPHSLTQTPGENDRVCFTLQVPHEGHRYKHPGTRV